MIHPQQFLLEKIVGYPHNGLNSLGQLDAKHVKDIVQIMTEFAEATAIEVAERLARGEKVQLSDGRVIKLIKPDKRKKRAAL